MRTCPHCGISLDIHVNADGSPHAPKRGDIALCSECNGIAVFDGEGMRDPTGEEMDYILTNPQIQAALAQKAAVDKLFERLKKKPSEEG